MKILVSDSLSPKGIEILKDAGFDVDVNTSLTPDQLRGCIGQYDALLIRSGTQVTAQIIEAADNLKVVGRAGVGVDNVDVPAATKAGVVVMNTPGGNTITTAEHALSLLTSLARHIPQADEALRDGRWERKLYQGVELAGKTLGIIGLGRIGTEIAVRVQAMGMSVIAFDPVLSQEHAKEIGVKLVSLEELYPEADFITVHTPLNEHTKYLINTKTMAKMKKGVFLINCARGGIICEKDLYEALQSGQVAGAALDVFEQEPPAADNPLLKSDKVICTPHLGASTTEAQDKVALDVAEQVVVFLKQGMAINAVNLPAISPEKLAVLDPWLKLSQTLGKILGQLIGSAGKISGVEVSLTDDHLYSNSDLINNNVLIGITGSIFKDRKINLVNVLPLSQELGIKVSTAKKLTEGDYTNLISVKVFTDKGVRSAQATLMSGNMPRIIMLDNFKVEFRPSHNILVLFNQDKPGIIGNIGTFLGERSINIAGMQFGRQSSGGEAISIFRTDSPVPMELLPQLERLPHIKSAHQVNL